LPRRPHRPSQQHQSPQPRPPAKKAPAKPAAPKPAAKKAAAPAKAAPAKKAAAEKVEQVKITYQATGRSGRVRTQQSATPLVAALDAKIGGRTGAHYGQGVVCGFYTDKAKAQAAADEITQASTTAGLTPSSRRSR
jgi:hypothetical protein